MPSFFKKNKTIYDDPTNGERWYQEDLANATEASHKANVKNMEVAKEYFVKGQNPGISSESGKMLKPPPGYDFFDGKVCQAVGLVKNGFGQAKICGRQATMILQVAQFEPDIPKSPSSELTEDVLSAFAYGGPNPVPAAEGKKKGHMVTDPMANGRPVCAYHSMALTRDILHVADGGVIPDTRRKVPEMVITDPWTLRHERPWRAVGTDQNFTHLFNGIESVTVRTVEYKAYLGSLGVLPEDGRLM